MGIKHDYIGCDWDEENCILYFSFREPIHIDTEEANEILKFRNRILKKHPEYILVELNNLVSVTSAASKILAKKEAISNNRAMAVVARNYTHKMLTNFYIEFGKPETNIKVFKDNEKAELWLKECIIFNSKN